MLDGGRGAAAGYWLQLLLAMGIATLGLVLGSTAVVIGAMLVSPLMTPILSLGMGLAVGSPLLVLRSSVRIVASVMVVIAGAAAITLVVPIHEVTAEIASRTAPTALDLAIASCCAAAGVYAVIRPGSDTASAAAGTSIGIALVPPLCVVGYGAGTSMLQISSGAALLFTANLCAILLFSVLGFLSLGYGHVAVAELEREHAMAAPPGGITLRLARKLSVFFASRLGPAVRVAMPIALVLAVYLPLRKALAEVTWEIRVRGAVSEALRSSSGSSVHSSVRIERHTVSVRLVTVGSDAMASRLRAELVDRIAAISGVAPTVEVVAVPDAKELARAEAELRDRPIVPAAPVVPRADLAVLRKEVDGVLASWPADAAGALLRWKLSFATAGGGGTVEVVHLGRPLGRAAESMLTSALSAALHEPIRLVDVVFDPDPISATRRDVAEWLPRATDAISRLRAQPELSELFACIETPTGAAVKASASSLRTNPSFADPRVTFVDGSDWALRWSRTPCASGADAGASYTREAGASEDAGASR